MFESIRYFLLRALRNMSASPVLCSASVLTMAVALAAVGAFLLVVLNLHSLTANWREDVQLVAYLDQLPPADELGRVEEGLRGWPEVEGVVFVSRQQALERFRKRLGPDSDLLTGIDAAVLPASLEISFADGYRDRVSVERVAKRMRAEFNLGDLQYGRDWLEQFEAFTALLELVGTVLGAFLVFAAAFIVTNTIKLTLYARRDELEVMSLVGATLRFIKLPFLIEGLLQGLLGGLLALAILAAVYHLVLREGLQVLLLTPAGFSIRFLPPAMQYGLAAAGVALGVTGSLLALRKFVRI